MRSCTLSQWRDLRIWSGSEDLGALLLLLLLLLLCIVMLFVEQWVASFDGLWPFWQPATAYKHIVLYVIDVFASCK